MADQFPSSVATSGRRQNPSPSIHPPQLPLRFWIHQPIVRSPRRITPKDDPIKSPNSLISFLKRSSRKLPNQFDWTSVNVDIDRSLSRLDGFIRRHYFDDEDSASTGGLSFSSSRASLRWWLSAPGSDTFLHVGIRDKATKKLAGFIAATPATIRMKRRIRVIAIANLLCIHKNHRSKRLAPVLINELTRRATVHNIWHGVFATEAFVPTPLCSCRWLQRYLNPRKLRKIGYNVKMKTKRKRIDPAAINIPREAETSGFRKMGRRDVNAVAYLLKEYVKKFRVAPVVDEHFVDHYLLPKHGVVDSYVVEDPATSEITDFCSFVIQKKEIRKRRRWWVVKCAVLFYYAARTTSPAELIRDLVATARNNEMDIFRAQGIMGNDVFLPRLRFEAAHDMKEVNYYLYNYGLATVVMPQQFGVVIL